MYRPPDCGLGNVLMHLCYTDNVSDKIYDGGRGKFLIIKKNIMKDDLKLDTIIPPTYIVPDIHSNISHIIEPTEYAKQYINKYKHLIDNVEYAFQIRRGSLSNTKQISDLSSIFCTDDTLNKFENILDKPGNVFISSDCLDIKHYLRNKYGDRIKFIDSESQFIINHNKDDPWVSFTEFFLLSMCPYVYMTGGNRDMNTFSTFGYMACMYGNVKFEPIFN